MKLDEHKVGGWGHTSEAALIPGTVGIGREKGGVAPLPKLEGGDWKGDPSTCPPAWWSLQAQDSHCPPHTALLRTHCACDSG